MEKLDLHKPEISKVQVQEEEETNLIAEKSQVEDALNLTREHLELAQKALAIELILIKILENLPTSSLANLRLVDKTWEKEATKIIIKGSKTVLRFRYERDSKRVVLKNSKVNLRDVNKLIRKSGERFPCSSLVFHNVYLKHSVLNEFFTLHGSEIKRLELWLFEQEPSKLGHVLLRQLPNVQVLTVHAKYDLFFPNMERTSPIPMFPNNSVLAHLKSLTYCDLPFASEIIRVSPNLKRVFIQGFSLDGLQTLASMNKIHIIKQIEITTDYEKIPLVQRLADGNPKIQIQQLCLDSPSDPQQSNEFLEDEFLEGYMKALSTILDSSKATLTRVTLVNLDSHLLVGVKWPRLENVRDLGITCYTENIPANFISNIFPNIQRLTNDGGYSPWLLNYQTCLTNLEEFIALSDRNLNLDKFWAFAPNLRKLKIGWSVNFPNVADSIWACSGLEELEISMSCETHPFPWLDMAFTGLSEEIVRKLHVNPDYFNEMKSNKEKIPRIQRSILDCPALAALRIVLRKDRGQLVLTSVSGEFGFKMLQDLQVNIWASSSYLTTLASLKPYAHLSTWQINVN